jgi:AcrR family transcriptional regulator
MNMVPEGQPAKRRYRMTARAAATAATGVRILDAGIALFWERPRGDITLEEVAQRAGVSLPTVMRHVKDKDGLYAAAAEREYARVRQQRGSAPPGDLPAVVRVLFDHYEELGDAVLRLLAEEQRIPALRPIADVGRATHREWCERMFAPALVGRSGADHTGRLAKLMILTDVYVWKLLRRDQQWDRATAERMMRELIEPLLGGE